jgi:hypothetical protein
MARRTVLAVVIESRGNAKRCQCSGVEMDGALNVAYRNKNMIKHGGCLAVEMLIQMQ